MYMLFFKNYAPFFAINCGLRSVNANPTSLLYIRLNLYRCPVSSLAIYVKLFSFSLWPQITRPPTERMMQKATLTIVHIYACMVYLSCWCAALSKHWFKLPSSTVFINVNLTVKAVTSSNYLHWLTVCWFAFAFTMKGDILNCLLKE